MTSSNPTAASNPLIPLVRVAIAELRQDPQNARSHDRRNLDAIKESLQAFGQVLPVVVRQGQIVGGNATTQAAEELGWTHLDATPADHLSAEEAVALAIALNRTAELASWDASVLVDALAGLPTLEGTGFTAEELAELEQLVGGGGAGAGLTDPDEVPEPPVEPVTRPGDLWLLGPHRLLCGDATKAEDVERLLDGENPRVVLTDPPYGIDYQAMRRDDQVAGDETAEGAEALIRGALSLTQRAEAHFLFCSWRTLDLTRRAMEAAGLDPKACIVWDKQRGVQNLDRFHKQHEFIVYAGPYGGQKTIDGDVWQCARDYDPDHPTPKPVELLVRALTAASDPGDLVLDSFAGSGSTLIAAHQMGRRAAILELDPRLVDQAARRWQEHTGEKPILEATGEPHDLTRTG